MEVILQLLILGYYPIVFQMIPVLTILLKMNNAYRSIFVVTVILVENALQYKTILRYSVNWIHLHVHVHVYIHVHLHVHVHLYIRVHVHLHVHVHLYIHVHVHVDVDVHVHVILL